eukprot:1488627-Amphidinium_carterae.1
MDSTVLDDVRAELGGVILTEPQETLCGMCTMVYWEHKSRMTGSGFRGSSFVSAGRCLHLAFALAG